MNRRGQLADSATMIAFGLIFAVCFLVGWLVLGTWNDVVSSSTVFPQTAKDANAAAFGDYGHVYDNMFLIIYVGIVIGSLVLSYVLRSNPATFFVVLVVVFIVSTIAGFLGNAYTTVAQASGLSGAAASMGMTGFIMDHYLLFSLVNTFLMLITFFAKPNDGGSYA